MFKKLFFFALFLNFLFIFGINLNVPQSAIQNAVAGESLIYLSPAASVVNPAIISPGLEISATYLFNMPEIPLYNLHVGILFGHFGIHLGNSFLNHTFYRENLLQMGFAYGWKTVRFGVEIDHFHVLVSDYNNNSAIKLNAGVIYENKNFTSGFSILNVSQTKCQNELLPVVISWESCLKISEKGKLTVGFEKEKEFDFSLKFAGRYDFFKNFTILTGYQYNPNRIGTGIIFGIGKIHFIYSVRTHQYLSLTHYISVNYDL
jgi:hypothetical protein